MKMVQLFFKKIPAGIRAVRKALEFANDIKDLANAEEPLDKSLLHDKTLYPVSIDSVLTGKQLAQAQETEAWQDLLGGRQTATAAKESGEVPCCDHCGRFAT